MARKVFINYRREDTQQDADALYDFLEKKVGRKHLFMDIDTIQPGQDFMQVVENKIRESEVLLMLIGPKWEDAVRQRAQAEEPDFVLQEIDHALASGKLIIPVLFYRSDIPDYKSLKDVPYGSRLPELQRVNAVRISRDYRKAGYERIVKAADLTRTMPAPPKNIRPVGIVLMLVVLAVILWLKIDFSNFFGSDEQPPAQKEVSQDVQQPEENSEAQQLWNAAQNSELLADYEAYLQTFPNGAHAAAAEEEIQRIRDRYHIPEMVAIDGGTFPMGSNGQDAYDNEHPVHEVTVSDFHMAKFEVTQEAYTTIMGDNPSHFEDCGGDCPVERVSWYDAVEYCNRLSMEAGYTPCYSYEGQGTDPDNWPEGWKEETHDKISCDFSANGFRLPTEAEWEYAAGGGAHDRTKYAGTDREGNLTEYAWYDANSNDETHPVGDLEENTEKIYDMSGNVWEWCQDWYNENYYKNSPKDNPKGPENGDSKVLRGGSWSSNANYCRVAVRYNFVSVPYGRNYSVGFRVAARYF